MDLKINSVFKTLKYLQYKLYLEMCGEGKQLLILQIVKQFSVYFYQVPHTELF